MSDKASATRARQACEPCRRKKTKCPGERPACSFCQRLGQRCSYERSGDAATRVHKARYSGSQEAQPSTDRIQRLESRVEAIFDILSDFTNRVSESSSPPPVVPQTDTTERPASQSRDAVPDSHVLQFDVAQSQEPPKNLWPALLNIYKQRFHCQPLPILNLDAVSADPRHWPRCLRHSFLSLTAPFVTTHAFFAGRHREAITFYSSAARREILGLVADGVISLELLQSTCLSALGEIIASNPCAARMSISVGVQLVLSYGIMSRKPESKIISDNETRSQCCWSLFMLDRMYNSSLTIPLILGTETLLPDYPRSAACPNLTTASPNSPSPVRDLGVCSYGLQLLSIWDAAMQYLRSVKEGESEDAWMPQSRYHTVMAELFAFETKFAQIHRFQQTRFQEHDLDALEQSRAYWMQWLLMQFLFHAVQGLVNHPFLHIASRSKRQGFPPPSFLQNTVDQAVMHSSWILKLIEVCVEKDFSVNNPFIGHLAGVTATVYLFLLSAKDADLAAQAKLGFDSSYSFTRSMSNDWPHLRHTIDKLELLQRAADTDPLTSATVSAPKAQRSLLWELLDYSASTTPSRVPEFATDAVDLNVDTRFLSPLNPLSTGHTPHTSTQHNNQQQMTTAQQSLDGTLWDSAFDSLGVSLFDNEQMADLANSTFARDVWNFGQL